MSRVAIEGNASGTGTLTIAAPNTNSDYTLTLPAEAGTVLTSGGAIDVNSSAPADSVVINSSGNVGIGTSSPAYKLEVQGSANTYLGQRIYNTNAGSSAVAFLQIGNDTNGATAQLGLNSSTNTTNFGGADGLYLANGLSAPIAFATAGSERMRITSGGEVYIAGTTDRGAFNLQCNGTGVWGAGAYVNGSDERIKDDIEPIASGLDVVEKLNPVTYRYKESWSKDQSVQTGFIAQELLTALDGKVYVDGVVQQGGSEGYYSVAYQNIIPILTKAIQELKAELDTVKAELADLKGQA
jgi:hypothetical protein